MLIFNYHGTFEGLLTCIFEGFGRKRFADEIQRAGKQTENLYAEVVKIESDSAKATAFGKAFSKNFRQKTSSCSIMRSFRKKRGSK